MQQVWRIELLGTLRAVRESQEVTRFRTRRVASLLGYLAHFQQRIHSRDEIAEMLWPGEDLAVSRRNLRQALSSLRHVLEPPPMPAGSVILSISDGIQLSPETATSDVAEFEALIVRGRRTAEPAHLRKATEMYRGDLLPGFRDEWILGERLRLEDLYVGALRKLGSEADPDEAISHLRSGVVREPYNEEWHRELIKRYLEIGRPDKALEQFAELKRLLSETFGQTPSPQSIDLADRARRKVKQAKAPDRLVQTTGRKRTDDQRVSLPVFANRYFGRASEIAAICGHLEAEGSRLVTILGPAGVGKTRLSVQCARALAERQPWNVWFVPLADRFRAAELYEAVIAVIDPKGGASSQEIERISELTLGRQCLIVLDNLEQIADEAGEYVARMLSEIPNVRFLTTSRQPLQIQGEQILAIEPLPLPTGNQRKIAELAQIPSIQLFVDRCQLARPDLQFNERNSKAIVALCSRLDGLPLALEIAAGLSNSYSPAQMVNHIPANITGLTSRRRDTPARHRSLRAAIDWSYDSLPPDLQLFFRRLCVFRSGFTLGAASEVCFDHSGDRTSENCLEVIRSLVERSLVRSQPAEDGREPRFSLLTAFREYAEEQIPAPELGELRERHAEYFVSRAPPDRPFVSTEEQTLLHQAIEFDYDNFTEAIEFSLATGNIDRCVRLQGILALRWLSRGPRTRERGLIRQIAERPELASLSAERQVQVQRMLGTTYIRSGEYRAAYDACSKAIRIAMEDGDPELLATCYSGLSVCAGFLGNMEECLSLNLKVLELAGESNLSLAERSYLGVGSALGHLGRLAESSEAFQRARTISEKLRGGQPDAMIVINLARVALDRGQSSEALSLAQEAIKISRRLQDEITMAIALTVVSRYHWLSENMEAATATNLQALELCRQGDFLHFIIECLRNQAVLWTDLGDFVHATTLLAAASDCVDATALKEPADVEKALVKLRQSLTKPQFESAWARGLTMDRSAAIRFALAPDGYDFSIK